MNPKSIRIMASFLLLGCATPPLALETSAAATTSALTWKTTRIELAAAFGQQDIAADFPFRCAAPVTILSVRPDCSCCTTAALQKWTYLPGDAGVVQVKFHIGERVGVQIRTILVTTAGNPNHPDSLTLVVKIPELARVEPQVILWDAADKTPAKSFLVTLNPAAHARIGSVTSTRPDLQATIQALGQPDAYRIELADKARSATGAAIVTVRVDATGGSLTIPVTVVFR